MALIQETAYPRLKTDFTESELERNFKPTEAELFLIKNNTKKNSIGTQLGFLITLKCYQCLGKPILIKNVPDQIKFYISKIINSNVAKLLHYDSGSVRKQHLTLIREYLGINLDKQARRQAMKKVALVSAASKENVADIINDILEELIRLSFELPAFRTILRLSLAARQVVSNSYYDQVNSLLSEENKILLDNLFSPQTASTGMSEWRYLKKDPEDPTYKNVNTFIDYVDKIKRRDQQLNISIDFIPPSRMGQYVSEAMSLDISDMMQLRPVKRYFLAVVLIVFKKSKAIDDLASILIRWIRKLHTDGQESLNQYRLKHTTEVEGLVKLLHNLLSHLKSTESLTEVDKLAALENCVSQGIEEAILQCENYMAHSNGNYYSFMLRPYKYKRSTFFKLINHLEVKSSSQDLSIEEALNFIQLHSGSHKEWLDIQYHNPAGEVSSLDLSWLSERWFKAVTGKNKGSQVSTLHRHYFELAVLSALTEELNCGDVYVQGADHYDDPNKSLISWEQFHQELDNYARLHQLPTEADLFVDGMQSELRTTAQKVDDSYTKNEYLSIKNNEPVVKKSPTRDKPKDLKKMTQMLTDRMPQISIIEAITDVEKWLNLSLHFKPHSGYQAKLEQYGLRFISTSFAYGCNVGPTQAERSLKVFSRKQIAWLFNHHITEEKLDKASEVVTNLYNKFALPKKWGTGSSISVDATYVNMYQKNLVAEYHIRYGGYGGLAYYHVSDMYISTFGNFISCGVHESSYLFDGIIANTSDIQADTVHGDTHAQNEVVFGFSKLLSIHLMPRIRNFKHLRYYKASKEDKYKYIEDIFADETINWELIRTHYYDMLRIIMSISSGKLKASVILRKLSSKSRKNKLYFAFRELGRVIRTIFLLNYINDVDMRQYIQAGTCKSEEYNAFIKWVRFGDGGTISDNMRYEQRKIIKYGRLISNMLMLHTVACLTKVVNEVSQVQVIAEEILKHQSPFHSEHINRLGIFPVAEDRKVMDLEFELVLKAEKTSLL